VDTPRAIETVEQRQCEVIAGRAEPGMAWPSSHHAESFSRDLPIDKIIGGGRSLRRALRSNATEANTRAQELLRIDRLVIDARLVVEVRAGGAAG